MSYPIIVSVTPTEILTDATSHSVDLGTPEIGDVYDLFVSCDGTGTITIADGSWSKVEQLSSTDSLVWFRKVADDVGETSVTVSNTASESLSAVCYISRGQTGYSGDLAANTSTALQRVPIVAPTPTELTETLVIVICSVGGTVSLTTGNAWELNAVTNAGDGTLNTVKLHTHVRKAVLSDEVFFDGGVISSASSTARMGVVFLYGTAPAGGANVPIGPSRIVRN